MRAKQQDHHGLLDGVPRQLGSIDNLYSFTLLLVLIVCLSNIAMRFISRWDGHFHDTKGCTTLQAFHGKLFKVNSCDNNIVNIGSVPYDYKKIPDNTNNPVLPASPEIKAPPLKTLPPQKPTAQPKESPYMI